METQATIKLNFNNTPISTEEWVFDIPALGPSRVEILAFEVGAAAVGLFNTTFNAADNGFQGWFVDWCRIKLVVFSSHTLIDCELPNSRTAIDFCEN